MGGLMSGHLTPGRAKDALRELQEIEDAFRKIPVSEVFWNGSDDRRGDNPNEAVNHKASNAFEHFVDIDGRPLISRLRDAVQECLNNVQVLRIAYPSQTRDVIVAGLILAGFGLAWMSLGCAYVPRWVLVSGYTDKAKVPVWTFGMDFVMLGVAIIIPSVFPSVGDWLRRRPLILFAGVISAIIGWFVVCTLAGFLPD